MRNVIRVITGLIICLLVILIVVTRIYENLDKNPKELPKPEITLISFNQVGEQLKIILNYRNIIGSIADAEIKIMMIVAGKNGSLRIQGTNPKKKKVFTDDNQVAEVPVEKNILTQGSYEIFIKLSGDLELRDGDHVVWFALSVIDGAGRVTQPVEYEKSRSNLIGI